MADRIAQARERFEKSLVDLSNARRLHARNPSEANLWRYEQRVERERRELVRAFGELPETDNQVVEALNRALDAAQNNQGRLSRKRKKTPKEGSGYTTLKTVCQA